jgi:hypothetical protein
VIDLDAALGQQLLHVPIGQPVPEIPADRHRDHLGRKPEPGKRRPVSLGTSGSNSAHRPQHPQQGPAATTRVRPMQQSSLVLLAIEAHDVLRCARIATRKRVALARKPMQVEVIEWDDDNLEHATRQGMSAIEIEQAIANATVGQRTSEAAPATFGSTRRPTAGVASS